MEVPSILQGESLKRLLQGAAVGAVATIVVGFSWGGWSLGSTAGKMAKEQTEQAVKEVEAIFELATPDELGMQDSIIDPTPSSQPRTRVRN